MGNHHEENVPQNPNKSEKTRFDFAPDSSNGSEPIQVPIYEPMQQADLRKTRFGMVPTLPNPATQVRRQPGHFRLEGSAETNSETGDSSPSTQAELVYSHSEKKGPKVGAIFADVFFRFLQTTALFLLFSVLLGLGAYFVFYGLISSNQAVVSDPSDSVATSTPPSVVRFFDLVASGRQFVFLIDATELMEVPVDSSSWLLIKSQLQQSLRNLGELDSYELFDFSAGITSLVPANDSHLSSTSERIENLQPGGTGDLKKAIFAALALGPDVLFLLCHSANAEQLNAVTLEEIQSVAGKTRLYAVEVTDSIKPLFETPLERLTRNLRGDYQWLNILRKTSQGNTFHWIPQGNYENVSIPPLTGMIETDFRFYVDVSRPETREHSPFGKEIVTSPNRFPADDNSLSSPKQLSLSDSVIREIETDARIVYMSGLTSIPHNPPMLHTGAENRLALWIEGAKAELPAAEYLIGLCYKNGVRVTTNTNKAFQCQLKAALQGCQPAMFLVAMEYLAQSVSDSTNQNAVDYMKYWVEKGAKLGEPLAQCYWANHFTNTPEERFSWLEKAANQTLPEAQYLLGRCFETGNGTDVDRSVAVVWYEKAARQGHTAAQIALDKLKSESTE